MKEISNPSMAHPTVKAARVAGAWYLLLVITGAFSYMYLPSLIVPGNATATANNIVASETIFHIAIIAELTEGVVAIFLSLALYRLLKGVNKEYASLMVILGALVSVPILFLNVLNEFAALILLSGANFLSGFNQAQLDSLSMVFLNLHSQGLAVSQIFAGLWLFPFGILVYRSGFIPRIFGILLVVNGFAYLGISLVSLLSLPYGNVIDLVLLPPQALGQLSIVAWLLIKGAKVQSMNAQVLKALQSD